VNRLRTPAEIGAALRYPRRAHRIVVSSYTGTVEPWLPLMGEAADCIAALVARLAVVRRVVVDRSVDCDGLRAEVAAVNAALDQYEIRARLGVELAYHHTFVEAVAKAVGR
jgi:hypothetical protein